MKDFWYQKEIDALITEIVAIKNRKELLELFDQILTPRELNDMGRRKAIITLLNQQATYQEISEKYGASPNIIAKLSHKIGYGFRRTSKSVSPKPSEKSIKSKKSHVIKYKGATPIHKMFD